MFSHASYKADFTKATLAISVPNKTYVLYAFLTTVQFQSGKKKKKKASNLAIDLKIFTEKLSLNNMLLADPADWITDQLFQWKFKPD